MIAGVLGPGLFNVMLALSIIGWTGYARLVRGCVMSTRERTFVEASRAIGGGSFYTMFRHILPEVVGPVGVMATVGMGWAILSGAALSFLGLGAQPPLPEWGSMLNSGRAYMKTGVALGDVSRPGNHDKRSGFQLFGRRPSGCHEFQRQEIRGILDMKVLRIKDLGIVFPGRQGPVKISDGVDLEIEQGESLCLVGESGCGKTVVGLAIMNLLPRRAVASGKIEFQGRDLLEMNEREYRRIRGKKISMIFEQPATCLNPVFTVGEQIAEVLRFHEKYPRKESIDKAVELMRRVGIDAPEKTISVLSARIQRWHDPAGHDCDGPCVQSGLACRRRADDLARCDDSIADNRTPKGNGRKNRVRRFCSITHDLAIASCLCSRVAVMYAGSIVECGKLGEVFSTPRHPYTLALVKAAEGDEDDLLEGCAPEFSDLPEGCRFHPRCPWSQDICRQRKPRMEGGVRCHFGQSLELVKKS